MSKVIGVDLKPMRLPPLSGSPLVSVLIPNYNYARFLGAALDSLLKQSYKNWEAIICDDGSTDGSRELMQRYAGQDPRIRYVFQSNGGVAKALNSAYLEARGEIISLLDADDTFLPEKLALVVDALKSRPSAGMCIHPVQLVSAVLVRNAAQYPIEIADGWIGPRALENGGFDSGIPAASGLSFRAQVLVEIFPLPGELRAGLDLYLSSVAIMLTEVVGVRRISGLYRVHGNNTSYGCEPDQLLKTLTDQSAVWKARDDKLRRLFGAWPMARMEENRGVRTCSLKYYLQTGQMPGPIHSSAEEMLRKENSLLIRCAWKLLIKAPRVLQSPLIKIAVFANSVLSSARASSLRRARWV